MRPSYPSPLSSPPAIVTIGTFDGVHVGHAALIRRAREAADALPPRPGTGRAGESTPRVVAYTFDPHPLTRLRPESAPPILSTFDQRSSWLREAGADEVIRLEPTDDLLAMTPEAFIDHLQTLHAIAAIVEGPDFRFGRGRAGDVMTLAALGQRHGFAVHIVAHLAVALGDQSVVPASSSMARWLIAHGRTRDAAIILGRPYDIPGRVVRGDGRGRSLGFPTANIDTPCLLPADGVYAAEALLEDGRAFAAAVSVGTKPTFGHVARTLEALLLTTPGDDGDAHARGCTPAPIELDYDWPIRLRLHAWLRDQVRYASPEALVEQMRLDCARAMTVVAPPRPAPEPAA